MLKAFKTESTPDKIQAQKIRQSIGNCRWLYNRYIAYNLKLYRMNLKILTIGTVKLKEFGYLPTHAKIKNGTVSFKAGRYFVSVVEELPDDQRKCKDNLLKSKNFSGEGIEIDLGIKNLAVFSDGNICPNINKSEKIRHTSRAKKFEPKI